MNERVWTFRTANFEVFCEALPEVDQDLSWADEETLEKIDSGEYVNICWHVGVIYHGKEIGSDFLGNSVYENPGDFVRHHLEAARAGHKNAGGYFPDMVKTAIGEARDFLKRASDSGVRA